MTRHRYAIFETQGGFCGIAWNDAGISRFQLPTNSDEGTEKRLLHRLPKAERGAPPPRIEDAIAAVKRYFAGERIDFSHLVLDLEDQDEFFRRIYSAVRRVGWGQTTTYGNACKGTGRRP